MSEASKIAECAALAAMLYVRRHCRIPGHPEARPVGLEFDLDRWRDVFERAYDFALEIRHEDMEERVQAVCYAVMQEIEPPKTISTG